MKTKTIVACFLLLVAMLCLFTACDEATPTPPNENEMTACQNHTFGEWTQTKAPTCTEKGSESRSCTACGYSEIREKELVDYHQWQMEEINAPSCIEGQARKYCKICDVFEMITIPAKENPTHVFALWEITELPTCTEKGEERRDCDICDHYETREVVANGHSFGEWTETLAPTCTEKGSERRDCDNCDHYETREIVANGHTNAEAVVENRVEATCTADGSYDSVIHCSVCQAEVGREAKTLEKLGHDYSSEWTVDVEPTCTEAGSQSHHCSRCGDKADVTEIPANGHTGGRWITDTDATCTEDGSKHQICSVCEATIKTETLIAFGHNYDESLPEGACINKAIVYQCQNCEDTYSKQLQAISANIDYCYWSYVDSTCYVQDILSLNGIQGGHGKYTITITYTDPVRESHVYTYTNVDNLNTTKYLGGASWATYYRQYYPPFVTIEIEDELGFKTTYTAYFPTLDSSYYNNGYNYYSQDVVITVSTTTVEHAAGEWITDKEANCTEDGSRYQICSVCTATIKTEILTQFGHTAGEWTQTLAPTCTEKGEERRDCDVCDHYETREIAATGHTIGDWTQTLAPTCTEKGEERGKCYNCDHYETRKVAPNGHNYVKIVTPPPN